MVIAVLFTICFVVNTTLPSVNKSRWGTLWVIWRSLFLQLLVVSCRYLRFSHILYKQNCSVDLIFGFRNTKFTLWLRQKMKRCLNWTYWAAYYLSRTWASLPVNNSNRCSILRLAIWLLSTWDFTPFLIKNNFCRHVIMSP